MWTQINKQRWERSDGAVVKYDEAVQCNTACPWLPNHRGFMAYGPGKDQHNYIGFFRKNRNKLWPKRIPTKYKTPQSAMKAVNEKWPLVEKSLD
jgi:hypothetical protein